MRPRRSLTPPRTAEQAADDALNGARLRKCAEILDESQQMNTPRTLAELLEAEEWIMRIALMKLAEKGFKGAQESVAAWKEKTQQQQNQNQP